MAKVIKIETGTSAVIPAGMDADYDGVVGRISYDDGKTAYVPVDAFPDIDTLVADVQNPDHFIGALVRASTGHFTAVDAGADSVPEWTTLFSA